MKAKTIAALLFLMLVLSGWLYANFSIVAQCRLLGGFKFGGIDYYCGAGRD